MLEQQPTCYFEIGIREAYPKSRPAKQPTTHTDTGLYMCVEVTQEHRSAPGLHTIASTIINRGRIAFAWTSNQASLHDEETSGGELKSQSVRNRRVMYGKPHLLDRKIDPSQNALHGMTLTV